MDIDPSVSHRDKSIGHPVATGAAALSRQPLHARPITRRVEWRDMKQTEYRKLLLHPNWQKKRLEILSRDGFECSECGSKERTLHVHHMFYEKGRAPWDYPDISLVTLCDGCHEEEHAARYAREQDLLVCLRKYGISATEVDALACTLNGVREADESCAKEFLHRLVDVVNWSELYPDARREFIAFAVAFREKHIDRGTSSAGVTDE